MTHAWTRHPSPAGKVSGSRTKRTPAGTRNVTTESAVHAVHRRPKETSELALARSRQGTVPSSGRLGSAAVATLVLPAGDRAAHDHEVGLGGQVGDLRGEALALGHDADVARVELAAEGLERGVEAGVALPGPLGERRVPGVVHAYEP